jgi:riboflavin biosynthesis pyrimidine reductase
METIENNRIQQQSEILDSNNLHEVIEQLHESDIILDGHGTIKSDNPKTIA